MKRDLSQNSDLSHQLMKVNSNTDYNSTFFENSLALKEARAKFKTIENSQ